MWQSRLPFPLALPLIFFVTIYVGSVLMLHVFPLPFFPFVHIMYFRTKRLGLVLKILALLLLPVPLVLWPIVGVVCSFLGGTAYGFFAPLLATFEAVGVNVTDKFFHCFVVSHSPFTN